MEDENIITNDNYKQKVEESVKSRIDDFGDSEENKVIKENDRIDNEIATIELKTLK